MVTIRREQGVCRFCGCSFIGPPSQQFCAWKCFNKSRRRGVMEKCSNPECGERFFAGSGCNGYCSWDCYKADIPRRLEKVLERREAFLESTPELVSEQEVRCMQSMNYISLSKDRDIIGRILAMMSSYEKTVPAERGITAYELGGVLGFRFGERTMRVEPLMLKLQKETALIAKVPHESSLSSWRLTTHGKGVASGR